MSTSSNQARDRDAAPDRIGPYEVLGRLATGGMAELLLARKVGIEGFQKVVVLKRILPMFANNPDFVEMFLHEARLAATLEHPNIVQVFDIGKSDDDYYFAMAYLHGKDALAILRELTRRSERLPVIHAITIACGIAAGLHHAHEQVGFDGKPLGIVHRDVSPANAIVTYDGSVKLVDFGIAKAAASANVTRIGVRKGKAAYMSPEQCRGDPLDRRTDIWSLGVVLYEMLTMARLYRADTDLAIMHRIVSQDVPPPSSVVADLPRALEAIVLRCLARDREHRFATALELQHELESCARALHLVPTAGALGSYVRATFGSPPPPWHSGVLPAPPSVPVTGSVDIALDSAPSEATRDLVATPPPQLETAIGPPPSAPRTTAPYPAAAMQAAAIPAAGFSHTAASRPSLVDDAPPRSRMPVVLAVAGALALVGGLAIWRLAPSDTPAVAPAVASAAVPAAEVPSAAPAREEAPSVAGSAAVAAPAPPTAAELEAWLAAVHQTDVARALPFAARHELLERLAASAVASRIDGELQAALDLVQADLAPQPCRTFAAALERIAAARLPDHEPTALQIDALARAHVPDPTQVPAAGRAPDASCDGLADRLDSLRTPAKATSAKESAVRRPKKPVAAGEPPKTTPPTRRDPPPPPSKLDDELRPFHK